ncbi:RNase H domain-containing protein [Trichonephila clavipes]|nr:RNase H domain-containing protein [Trichonephila clavipes]
MYAKSIEARASTLWCGVEVRSGECQLKCRPRRLTMVQNSGGLRQKPSRIEKVIPNDCEIEIFADGIVLWSSVSDIEKVEESVNLALADTWSFAVNHKLSFSPSKSTVGFFTTNRKLYNI